jgi:trehalose-phosphatase
VPDNILHNFWTALRGAQQRILVLDYDGTLAPLVPDRHRAWPYPGVEEALQHLLATAPSTQLCFVTGRSVDDLQHMLPLAGRCAIWGCHGLELRLPSGERELVNIGPATKTALQDAQTIAEQFGQGDRLEAKPGCLALHWRGVDSELLRELQTTILPAWARIAGDAVRLHNFDGGIELRSTLADKGRAVRQLKRDAGEHCVLAYLGDDATDEDAFAELEPGDLGVLVRTEQRATQASLWLRPPDELLHFLDCWSVVAGRLQSSAGGAS